MLLVRKIIPAVVVVILAQHRLADLTSGLPGDRQITIITGGDRPLKDKAIADELNSLTRKHNCQTPEQQQQQ